MVKVPLHDVGRIGMINDLPAHELPPEAWSDSLNVRFEDNKIVRANGHSAVYDPPTVNPYFALFCPGLDANLWLYGSTAKVYAVDTAGTHTDMTRTMGGDYSMNADLLWNGGILGGIPVINNGIDVPQYWATIETATKLANLPNWPANTTARILRPFKNFLVALDVTLSGTRSPHKVKWSHSADPGTIPDSWNEADATKDAGEVELTDVARGFIIDGRELGDLFIIYKQSSIWTMQFIGGQFIFRFAQAIGGRGAYAKHCITDVGSEGPPRHFVFTGDDIVLFDGRQAESILDNRMRAWLLENIGTTRLNRAFCTTNYPKRECWFCFPTEGSDWPNRALIWNWVRNTITVREIVESSFIAIGDVTEDSSVSLTWDTDTEMWDEDTTLWTSTTSNPNELRLLQCAPVLDKLYIADQGADFNGTSMSSFVERTGLAIAGQDRNGQPKVDYTMRKFVNRIWPRISGGPVSINIGMQDNIEDNIEWYGAQTFDPATEEYLDCELNGRLIAVRIDGIGNNAWECKGYDLEVEGAGVI